MKHQIDTTLLFIECITSLLIMLFIAGIISIAGIPYIPALLWIPITIFSSLLTYLIFDFIFENAEKSQIWKNSCFFCSITSGASLIMLAEETGIISHTTGIFGNVTLLSVVYIVFMRYYSSFS